MIVKPPNLSYLHAQFKKAWQILLNNKFHCWFFLALTTLTDLFYYSCAKVIILKSFHQFRYIRWKKYTAVAIAQWLNLKIKGVHKVEKILKGSLDSIPSPSPSMKIQIMGGKVRLRCKGKTLLGVVNKLFVFKSLLTSPSNVLPYYLK